MKSVRLQAAGLLLIVSSVAILWMLDLYGASFNTAGSSRLLPTITTEYVKLLALPLAIGCWLILRGRLLR